MLTIELTQDTGDIYIAEREDQFPDVCSHDKTENNVGSSPI